MKADERFPSTTIRVSDLSSPKVFTIDSVETAKFNDGTEKARVHFKETHKSLVLNETNWNRIAKIGGVDDDVNFPGIRIELFRDVVEYQGKPTDCIRARPPGGWENWKSPSTEALAATEEPPDWVK